MDWESPNFIQCQIILLCSSQPKKFCQPNTHCVSHTTQPTLDYYRFTALPIGSKLCISKYFHHLDLPWWLWPILSEAAVRPPRARVVGEPPILGQAAVRPLAPRQAAVAASVPAVQHHPWSFDSFIFTVLQWDIEKEFYSSLYSYIVIYSYIVLYIVSYSGSSSEILKKSSTRHCIVI